MTRFLMWGTGKGGRGTASHSPTGAAGQTPPVMEWKGLQEGFVYGMKSVERSVEWELGVGVKKEWVGQGCQGSTTLRH